MRAVKRELKKKISGPSWWRMKLREMLAKRPYDLAMFRFKTTLKAIDNFKQKEFNIESMVEQVSRGGRPVGGTRAIVQLDLLSKTILAKNTRFCPMATKSTSGLKQ